MLNGNIADFARSVRTFHGQAKALSGKQAPYQIGQCCQYTLGQAAAESCRLAGRLDGEIRQCRAMA